jgi:hypothetical protein
MITNLDPNLFTQVGLDSGALTMLGVIIHSVQEPGEYRGTVRREKDPEATFYVSADKNSPVAQVNIDLATVGRASTDPKAYCGGTEKNRFVVNPKGYVVFRVSGGAGGYAVHLRKAEEEERNVKVFDSRELQAGDIFSAIVLRPGTYSLTNMLTKAKSEIAVTYPKVGRTAYRPPDPLVVPCTESAIELRGHEKLEPGQGLNFHLKVPSRIKIKLVKPDDGPARSRTPVSSGWKKTML